MTDAELLRSYVSQRSQPAFAELVSRHVGLVYTAALRQLRGDPHRAQEVTQMVFIALATKAAGLINHPALPAWLHRATALAAADLKRREMRRSAYEAAGAQANVEAPVEAEPDWSRVRPILDQSIERLGRIDRSAILLRFFSALPYAEIGQRLRLTENAARMRVERALEKLREQLRRQGIVSTQAVLGAWLSSEAIGAVPDGVAAAASGLATASAGAATAAGTAAALSLMATPKLSMAAFVIVAAASSVLVTAEQRQTRALDAEAAALRLKLADESANQREHADLQAAKLRRDQELEDLESLPGRLRTARAQLMALREKLAAGARAKRMTASSSLPGASPSSKFSTLDQQPALTFQVPPVYSVAMRAAHISGQVMVRFVVDQGGFVRDATVLSSTNPALEQPTLDAINTWTFSPGLKLGQPVNTTMAVPIIFSLAPAPHTPVPPPPAGYNSPQDWFPPHS